MAYNPNQTPKKSAEQIPIQLLELSNRDNYFQQLYQQGYEMVGNPIQFPNCSDMNILRSWAQQYASSLGGEFVVEVNDPNYSTEPSNSIIFFIWRKKGIYGSPTPGVAQATPPVPQSAASAVLKPQMYANPIQVLEQLLSRLANILAEPRPNMVFQDTGELLYPFVTIRMNAYEHLGGRTMDLFLVKDGIHDYMILGNESHGKTGGRLTPYRDEMISIKTLGRPSFLILDEFKALDQNQQNKVIQAIQLFLTQY